MLFGTGTSDYQLVTVIVGVLLPILVAFITKVDASPKVRSITLLALSGVSAVLNGWLNKPTGDFDWSQAVLNALVTFVIGVATLYGLWKPTGISDAAKRSGVK